MDKPIAISNKILFAVWGALLTLTVVTIRVAGIDLGFINIVAALGIATAKASLVVLFFMDLRHEGVLFRHILFVALLVLGIFLGFTYFDIGYRY